jgi:hypothetical protein
MRRVASLRANRDGTITVRVGRNVEHISRDGKTHGELFDCVKYALISKHVCLPDSEIVALLDYERRRS